MDRNSLKLNLLCYMSQLEWHFQRHHYFFILSIWAHIIHLLKVSCVQIFYTTILPPLKRNEPSESVVYHYHTQGAIKTLYKARLRTCKLTWSRLSARTSDVEPPTPYSLLTIKSMNRTLLGAQQIWSSSHAKAHLENYTYCAIIWALTT